MLKYFITGSSGFIGKNLLKRLECERVYLFNRGDNPRRAVIDNNPDVIIHLAAEIYKDEEMFDSNLRLTYELLEGARLVGVKKFIYVGSSSEYGRKEFPMKETDLLEPRTMYEATKGACTLLCQAYHKSYGMEVVIARPFSLYGKDEGEHRLIPTLIRKMKKNEDVEISFGYHDFIYIEDFLDGIELLINNKCGGQIFNFGTGVQYSNIEVAEKVRKLLNSKSKIIELENLLRPFDSDNWVADNTKAVIELGWLVKHSLTEGLRKII